MSQILYILCIVFCIFNSFSANVTASNKLKLIIDNDAGGDDAMAIFLAILYEKYFDGPRLVGLTTANGNTIEENVNINNQRVLKVAKRQDIPIFRGSKKSLVITPPADDFYGQDGLGDTGEVLTDLIGASNITAVEALLKLSREYEGELIVVTLGTVTNVALALFLDHEFLNRLKHLYVAAGHIHTIKFPDAEFNARTDAESYHILTEAATPDKVTVFPYSQVQMHLVYEKDWRFNTLGAIKTDIMQALNKYEQKGISQHEQWHALDPAAVAVALDSSLVTEYKYSKNGIILCGEDRGRNTNEFTDDKNANVRMVYSVKKGTYQKFLLDVFSEKQRTA